MREILFRGKYRDNGEWVEGVYYKQLEYYGDPRIKHFIITSNEALDYDLALEYYEVIPETVGQFTSVLDKNNNKIFEHDIVKIKVKDDEGLGVVMYDNGAFMVADIIGNVGWNTLWEYYYNDWSIEVVGNKHDNPELYNVEDVYDDPMFDLDGEEKRK